MELMNRITASLAIIIVILLMVLSTPIYLHSQEKLPSIEAYFSPHGGCTEAVINELNKAKNTVLVQAYSFTSAPIAKALLNAHKRGVKVEVILDKSQRTDKYSSATFLFNAGISTKIDAKHAIAHSKVMIIDGETVITGSFNFTKAAEENNTENLLVIRDKKLAERYTKNWQEHERHSEAYTGKGEPKQVRVVPFKERSPLESKLAEYYNTLWAKIKEQWTIPEGVRKEMAGLETIIALKINKDGKVQEMRYEKRSGNPQYDQVAWQAIKKAEPFPPIPDEFGANTLEIGIRFHPD
jgi:TonB family protein